MNKYIMALVFLLVGTWLVSCDDDGIEKGATYLTDELITDTVDNGNVMFLVPSTSYSGDIMITWDRYHLASNTYYKKYTGSFSIPEKAYYHGVEKNITEIDSYTFAQCTTLTSLTIPQTIKTIGKEAFISCSALSALTLPDGITMISDGMAAAMTKLKTFAVPANVVSIGKKAFISCTSLTSVTIPDSSKLTTIGDYCFYGASKLTSFTIPSTVTSIGAYCFSNCGKLTAIHCKAMTPPALTDSICTNQPVLYVPVGTKATYQANALWNKFTTINEE